MINNKGTANNGIIPNSKKVYQAPCFKFPGML